MDQPRLRRRSPINKSWAKLASALIIPESQLRRSPVASGCGTEPAQAIHFPPPPPQKKNCSCIVAGGEEPAYAIPPIQRELFVHPFLFATLSSSLQLQPSTARNARAFVRVPSSYLWVNPSSKRTCLRLHTRGWTPQRLLSSITFQRKLRRNLRGTATI